MGIGTPHTKKNTMSVQTRTSTRSSSKRGAGLRENSGAGKSATKTLNVLGTIADVFKKHGMVPDGTIQASKGETSYPVLRFQVKADVEIAGDKYTVMDKKDPLVKAVYGIVLSKNANVYLTEDGKPVDTTSSVGTQLMLEDFQSLRVAHRFDKITGEDLGLIIITNSENSGFTASEHLLG